MSKQSVADSAGYGLPPLNALRAFSVAARTGNFTVAAHELHVSQAAVSRHIAHLERFLGVKLFIRRNREMKLTVAGEEYASVISVVFDEIQRATQQISPTRRDILRLNVYPTFAIRWLIPRLGKFHSLHPNVDVQLVTAMQAPRLNREHVDLTVVAEPLHEPGMRCDRIFEVKLVPVCSSRVLNETPAIERPEDLSRRVVLHALPRLNDWQRWFEGIGVAAPRMPSGLKFGNSALMYEAVGKGVGVGMAQTRFVEDDLISGRLIAPFPQAVPTGEIYFLATRQIAKESPAVAVFREWLLSEAHQDCKY